MNKFYFRLAEKITATDEYKNDRASVFKEYIKLITNDIVSLDKIIVKRLISASQIFYYSNEDSYKREGSIILSMLIEVCAHSYSDIVPVANSIFYNSGDFPNIKLLESRFPDISFAFNIYTEAARDLRLEANSVEELSFPLTNFQKELWDGLRSGEDVISVAPTSAGKTHIILSYLINAIINSNGAFVAIIVPTRALITEVSSKLYSILQENGNEDDVEICTIPKDEQFSDKTIFVMTQERLYEILQRGDISFNYLFIDEAHNISDESRGVLLHITLEKLLEDSSPQIIIGMPSPQYANSFTSVFREIPFTKKITAHSPVSKVLIKVTPKNRDLVIERRDTGDTIVIPKKFKGTKLSDIAKRLGSGQSNIIYRNQTNSCDNTADEISKLIDKKIGNQYLEEAAEYIESFIHEEYSLAKNLRHGVAFHYGPLPTSVRVLVENLVKEGHVNYIVCTSTLAEGVNLPAKNLFLHDPINRIPYKPAERLEDVKINNITGRAGRMLEHFSGNIFLIEPEKWRYTDYFDESKNKEDKIPTYFNLINNNKQDIITVLSGGSSLNESENHKFYTVANKLIKSFSNDELRATFSAPEIIVSKSDIDEIKDAVKYALNSIKVPPFVLESNPTVGYIQQNKVHAFLSSVENLSDWSLPHPKSEDLYDRILVICKKLIEFGVFNPSGEYSAEYIAMISRKWIKGFSLKEMINDQINWDKNNKTKSLEENEGEDNSFKINSSVRNIIKVINNDIRFKFSNAIKCYQLLLTDVANLKGIDISSVKLHYYLEIGASDERMMSLLNLGLSRETAKELHDNLPKNMHITSIKDLEFILDPSRQSSIHTIMIKEIQHLINRS
ncbi:DEAD/DEAH box helicase [Dickeya chrysanthemi]|uniref:DEAD/DEAH box helicase n=1 Tax=Dickeya chrysanthemi TaxID=556 RepID=UPI00039FB1D9|nr:DEAD/DEAH box helicase [Dickeya chrysanthemi]